MSKDRTCEEDTLIWTRGKHAGWSACTTEESSRRYGDWRRAEAGSCEEHDNSKEGGGGEHDDEGAGGVESKDSTDGENAEVIIIYTSIV